jgi:CelD/BcsL family acetyltransferase involved in cellulose biosynthesis
VAKDEMVYETLSSIEGLDSLEAEWDELVRAMLKPTPFLLYGWVRAWLCHYAQDAEPAIHIARRDGQLVAALPLVVRRRFGLRIASFVGDDRPFVDVLLASGESLDAARALCDYAAQSHDCASLGMISAESTIVQACGKRLRLVPRVGAPVLDLSDGFEQTYQEKYSSKARREHARRRRKLAELGKVELVLAKTPEELALALEDAFRLHALRWQGRFDGSTFRTDEGMAFNREALRALAEDDIGRILTLRLDGQTIAFEYYFLVNERMYRYRHGWDPAYAYYRLGVLNGLVAIERASDEGATTVEHLGGTERHKLEFSSRIEGLNVGIGLSGSIRGAVYSKTMALTLASRTRLKRSQTLRKLYLEHVAPRLQKGHRSH